MTLGTRATFADLGQTLAECFGVPALRVMARAFCTSCSDSSAMTATIREELEQRERDILAPQAAKSADTRGRLRPRRRTRSAPSFQRDRDRIVHCKAFRRLKHKTQVFFAPTGDHYRTRLTHTLEVSQIARTIAKVLHLHEELTEAIALGHDLGHTPFGHAGERVLSELVPGGFNHYEQSLRIVDVLENDGRGLNLTWEVRDGIAKHSKGKDGAPVGAEPDKRAATLEGQITRVADLIAYVNHDIDDADACGNPAEADLPQGAQWRCSAARRPLASAAWWPTSCTRRSPGTIRNPDERARCSRRRWSCGASSSTPCTRTKSRPPSSRRRRASSADSGSAFGSNPTVPRCARDSSRTAWTRPPATSSPA